MRASYQFAFRKWWNLVPRCVCWMCATGMFYRSGLQCDLQWCAIRHEPAIPTQLKNATYALSDFRRMCQFCYLLHFVDMLTYWYCGFHCWELLWGSRGYAQNVTIKRANNEAVAAPAYEMGEYWLNVQMCTRIKFIHTWVVVDPSGPRDIGLGAHPARNHVPWCRSVTHTRVANNIAMHVKQAGSNCYIKLLLSGLLRPTNSTLASWQHLYDGFMRIQMSVLRCMAPSMCSACLCSPIGTFPGTLLTFLKECNCLAQSFIVLWSPVSVIVKYLSVYLSFDIGRPYQDASHAQVTQISATYMRDLPVTRLSIGINF